MTSPLPSDCPTPNAPTSDVDLFSDEILSDPYRAYEQLREAGGAVWLSRLGMFALTRYEDVRQALKDWRQFTSSKGVMMNQKMNDVLRGILLCSDPPEHDTMRRVLGRPLTPAALQQLKERINREASALVERLTAKRNFDAVTELAQHLPVTVVSELVGLPQEGRERMLDWAAANFNCFGPMNQRTIDSFPVVEEMMHYAFTQAIPGKLKPDGWAAMIWEAAGRGEIRVDQAPVMMNDYFGPSLDTTIFATANAIWLFARNPEQWEILRHSPALIPNAINEVIRIESPIQNFSRVTTTDMLVDGVTIPSESRVVVSYGSANRDPRKWEAPERFDINRKVNDHVGFGHGVHQCLGNNLARLEIAALLGALVQRVRRFELHHAERQLNNVLRGFKRLDVSIH